MPEPHSGFLLSSIHPGRETFRGWAVGGKVPPHLWGEQIGSIKPLQRRAP